MKNLYKILFFSSTITGTVVSISSLSWFTAWMGLEVNLLSILPLMKLNKNTYTSEATMKYFMVQTMASSILLFSSLLFINLKMMNTMNFHSIFIYMICTSLLMKIGAAPFHFWFPEVMSGLKWEMNFFMSTWQKIGPMMLIFNTMKSMEMMFIIIILSSLVGGIQSLNQICLRKIMAYSSMNHMSWMLSAMMESLTVWLYYFLIYSIINFNIMFLFKITNTFYLNQLKKVFSDNVIKLFFMMNFYSLGGLPPFLGFLPKWITINFMAFLGLYMIVVLLVLLTMFSLFLYMRISFSSITLDSTNSLIKYFNNMSFLMMYFNIFSLIFLPVYTIISKLF